MTVKSAFPISVAVIVSYRLVLRLSARLVRILLIFVFFLIKYCKFIVSTENGKYWSIDSWQILRRLQDEVLESAFSDDRRQWRRKKVFRENNVALDLFSVLLCVKLRESTTLGNDFDNLHSLGIITNRDCPWTSRWKGFWLSAEIIFLSKRIKIKLCLPLITFYLTCILNLLENLAVKSLHFDKKNIKKALILRHYFYN